MSQRETGSVMLIAVMIMLILSLLAAAATMAANLESRMAFNDTWSRQAAQAADAGVEVARDRILTGLKAGLAMDQIVKGIKNPWTVDSPWVIELGDGVKASVEPFDLSRWATNGEITIVSHGACGKAVKTARVTMRFNNYPSYPIETGLLNVAGHYDEYDKGAPYSRWLYNDTLLGIPYRQNWHLETGWDPWGRLKVSGGAAAFNGSAPGFAGDFRYRDALRTNQDYPILGWPPVKRYVEKVTDSPSYKVGDFLNATVKSGIAPPVFTVDDAERFLDLARSDPASWQVWEAGTFNIGLLNKPFNYIKGGPQDTVRISFSSTWFDQLRYWWEDMWARIWGTPVPDRSYPKVVIVSPAPIEVTLNGSNIDFAGGYLFLLSPGGVKLTFSDKEPLLGQHHDAQHSLGIYALSGNTLDVDSFINTVVLNGSLNAGTSINLRMKDYKTDDDPLNDILADTSLEGEALIDLRHDPALLEQFPYKWVLLGVGSVTSYSLQ